MTSDADIAQQAILEAVDTQLENNNPPITRETWSRLRSEGFTSDEARKLIGYALANEISEIMNNGDTFNEARYSQNLDNLPDIPWEQ